MRTFLLALSVLVSSTLAQAQPVIQSALDTSITIESTVIGGRLVDVVRVPTEEPIYLPTEPSNLEDLAIHQRLSPDELREANEARRKMLIGTLRALYSSDFSGEMLVQENRGYSVDLSQEKTIRLGEKFESPAKILVETPVKEKKVRFSRLKKFLSFLNEAILMSTYRAFRDHFSSGKRLSSRVNEYGVSIVFKAELQVGVGQFNITKILPLSLRIGYNTTAKNVFIRVGIRKEEMAGGSAISAGAKLEFRVYRMFDPSGAQKQTINGFTWYPPSLPLVGVVADHADTYSAQGLVFALNAADLIPGAYLVNTVNRFKETNRVYRLIPYAKSTEERLREVLTNHRRTGVTRKSCSQVLRKSA